MWEQYLTDADKAAIEQEKQRAQEAIARLNKEKLDILAKLRRPMPSSESERLGLRLAEIDRALPTITPDSAYWIDRIKRQAAARSVDANIKSKEEAAAAKAEADRQAAIRQSALDAYLAQGGSAESFEVAWIGIKQDLAREAALEATRTARQSTGSATRDAAKAALAASYGRPKAAWPNW